MEQVKKKKKKVKYSILFVPDVATEDVKKCAFNLTVGKIIGYVVTLVLVVGFVYCFSLTGHVVAANKSINSLQHQVEVLTGEKQSLSTQNDELQEQIGILSETVKEKVQMEEQEAAELEKEYIPTAFPLKGTASYSEDEQVIDGNPAAFFEAMTGTEVVATAKGKVTSVTGDIESGFAVSIDHGNGYITVYRNQSSPMVEAEQEVSAGTVIYVLESGYEKLGYQIMENGQFIDPLSLMEIYG